MREYLNIRKDKEYRLMSLVFDYLDAASPVDCIAPQISHTLKLFSCAEMGMTGVPDI